MNLQRKGFKMIKIKEKAINFYNKNGYKVVNVFSKKDIGYFENLIKKKIKYGLSQKKWKLSKYHKHANEEIHKKAVKSSSRFISVEKRIRQKIKSNRTITSILRDRWGHSNLFLPDLNYLNGNVNSVKIKNSNKNQVSFRIVVPKKIHYSKSAPAHIDINNGKIQDREKDGDRPTVLTLWTPIIGFTKKYTLRFAPGSHLTKHPISKKIEFITPFYNQRYTRKFKFTRLNLKKGQAILFDINLLHGGADNLGTQTRASLEFRLYNSDKVKFSSK